MEGLLVVVAIIFFIVKNVVKIKQQSEGQGQPQRPQTPKAPVDFEEIRKRFEFSDEPEKKQEKDFQGVNRPNAEGYEKIKTQANAKYESFEGSESSEGKCIEPNPDHCAVEHEEETVYTNEIGDEASCAFSKEDFVKGIIMSEIVSVPKSLR